MTGNSPSDPRVSAHGELIRVAAELARGDWLPSPYYDDWSWYRSTPMSERRDILRKMEALHEQAKRAAMRIRQAADELAKEKLL